MRKRTSGSLFASTAIAAGLLALPLFLGKGARGGEAAVGCTACGSAFFSTAPLSVATLPALPGSPVGGGSVATHVR